MPLFMDLHKASDYAVKPTVEDIKANHIADLAVQSKYGVKFLQYWINEEAGLVFCLMEAPDKESCEAVHQEAHGGMPCNVIELQGGDYRALMGEAGKVNAADIVERADGTLDTGYRIIMSTDIIAAGGQPAQLHEMIEQVVHGARGRFVRRKDNRTIAAFNEGESAIECALHIIQKVKEQFGESHEVRIGISAGEPVTDQKDLFADSIKLANHLCDIAQNGQVVITPLAKQLTRTSTLVNYKDESLLKMLDRDDERFLHLLSDHTAAMLGEPGFSIDDLGKKLGVSRSQLYRKITRLTGLSANAFIRELRMQRALQLIQNKHGNITQVAMETGFTNPSYFAKNFQDRFGISPLKALKNPS